jgi:phospholipid/cholesterol/gamma-HCH transport system ATP-binding protein
MIEVKNINKYFENTQVLFDINGKFLPGKANLIIGSSGTGKTVLLKCIVGLLSPDEGSVFYDGRDFHNSSLSEIQDIRREIGMLFQGGALFDSKNVEQNVGFPLDMLTNMPKDEKLDRINFILERLGLSNTNKKMPSELSGGMKKRVGLARAIVNNSRYLFCDEPNSGLDPQTAIVIDHLIQEITEEYNITTVVVTHDMNSVMEIGDYVMFMHKGQILWEGKNDDILGAKVRELQNFVYSNKLMTALKEQSS